MGEELTGRDLGKMGARTAGVSEAGTCDPSSWGAAAAESTGARGLNARSRTRGPVVKAAHVWGRLPHQSCKEHGFEYGMLSRRNYLDATDPMLDIPEGLPANYSRLTFQLLLCQNLIAFCNNPTSFPPIFLIIPFFE